MPSGRHAFPYTPSPFFGETSYFGSIYPSVQNPIGCSRNGFGRVADNAAAVERDGGPQTLGLPLSVTPICIVPMGWPKGRYGPTTRKPVEEVVHLDTYGNRVWKAWNQRDLGHASRTRTLIRSGFPRSRTFREADVRGIAGNRLPETRT